MRFLSFISCLLLFSIINAQETDTLSGKEKRKATRKIKKIEHQLERQAEIDKINSLIIARRWLWEIKTNENGSAARLGTVFYVLGDLGFIKPGPGESLQQYRVTSYIIEKRGNFVELQAVFFGDRGTIAFTLSPNLNASTIYFRNEKGFGKSGARYFKGKLLPPEESAYFKK